MIVQAHVCPHYITRETGLASLTHPLQANFCSPVHVGVFHDYKLLLLFIIRPLKQIH